MITALGYVFLSFGLVFIVVAAVGLVRLPDVYCRSHALGKAFTLGINSMLIGLWCKLGEGGFGLKVALIVFFLFVTIPVATHLILRLAYAEGLRRKSGQADCRND
ncbi:hypothetical protein ASA1KI_37060 [Opitutales bacterium ASA1]|jgi:multicomponent Na+:H+ antiporter subunit G|uniref:monovalent cation/H(+) antiporter subunit G n=1 Tax=Congregicoccus parvus TaxID=3081749 RepID=UPI002B32156C|nr:hypothetical protein ASA1KI_37060 [Opitutales bacterium ASA1]